MAENEGDDANTPANDRWTLSIGYMYENELFESQIRIVFLANGTIDFTKTDPGNYSLANALLQPTMSIMPPSLRQEFSFWKMINFVFVTFYWIQLADLGQISPTTYPPLRNSYRMPVNLSRPTEHPSTNNIFRNNDLFLYYTSFLKDTILPLLNSKSPEFLPLDDTNRLNVTTTTFIRDYSCVERQWKDPVDALVAVGGLSFSLMATYYTIMMFFMTLGRRETSVINPSICLILESTES